ncbi:endonuclease/exonuclease/phosphatase family protein [Desulfococcaceae bacterium HSG8]|nr:endonuclease/exonuclease/phosphatase family protein [Desulfococcaceae bacterium HSG8]
MFSVMTFNLRFGRADDGPNNWSYRQKAFPLLFGKYRPDFIGFQEANDFQTDFLRDFLDEYDIIGERKPAPAFWQNSPIFYKKNWKLIRHEYFFLSPTPEIPSRFRKSRWPRQCVISMFEKDDCRVICINTHFDFDTSVQTRSALLIMEQLSHLPPDIPGVLMGDFNARPSRACYQVFTGQNQAKDPCFKNTFKEPFPGTFHGFNGNTDGGHIDWILYRGGIVTGEAAVIRDQFGGIYPSDHFPLHVRFRWET